MFFTNGHITSVKNTTHKIVLPFYLYAALSFLSASLLLLFSANAFTGHYFNPQILAITHIMALGWGTMMILGASHQLVPVLTESSLYSNFLGYLSFVLAATGILLLVFAFYNFTMAWHAKAGGWLIATAVICYLVNLAGTITKSKTTNVHAVFVFTGALWLLITIFLGLALIYNFSFNIFSKGSLAYLPLHAHMGIAGWFLLVVIGVGSRLIPMFLISKYSNPKLLWMIYALINTALLFFIFLFQYEVIKSFYFFPLTMFIAALSVFGYYCYQCYLQRIRRKLDEQMKMTLLSVITMLLPMIILIPVIGLLCNDLADTKLILIYGFIIFFGWISSIIFAMTFKTLPFIVWNKVYHLQSANSKTPNPKDLFNNKIFVAMSAAYLAGILIFIAGVLSANTIILRSGATCLLLAAILYNWNVIAVLTHKKNGV
ncbi:MAG: cytochrome C oxidase subunit I [Ferruginibacter sp.]|nr:cytochrome C oxidase subunit I [Ferruginibacter sp.]